VFNSLGSATSRIVTVVEVSINPELQVLASRLGDLSKNAVIFDNAAQASIFGNRDLLVRIRNKDRALTYGGITSGKLVVTKEGTWQSLQVDYHPASKVNVLSQADVMEQGWRVKYNERSNQYQLYDPDGNVYVFGMQHRLYVLLECDVFSTCVEPVSMNDVYVCDRMRELCVTMADDRVATVKQNLKSYTPREARMMKEAIALQQKLGFPSLSRFTEFLSSGAMNNLPVTSHDAMNAQSAYGPLIPYLKGKTVSRNMGSARVVEVPRTISSFQSLEVDIMFVCGAPFLISVSSPLGLTMITPLDILGAKSARSVSGALSDQIAMYRSRRFEVLKVICDSESAMPEAVASVPGVQLVSLPSGQHAGAVEAKQRHVKNTVRSILHGLPFRLSQIVLVWCVCYAVYVINFLPTDSGYRASGVSPKQDFSGRRPDVKKDLRFPFGTFCQVAESHMSNSMDARTVSAVTLLPTGNGTGSVKCLNLMTGRIITRSQITALPWPQEYIEIMNLWADSCRKGTRVDIGSMFSDQENAVAPDAEYEEVLSAYRAGRRSTSGGHMGYAKEVSPSVRDRVEALPAGEAIEVLDESEARVS
jgi:hypothetical protein